MSSAVNPFDPTALARYGRLALVARQLVEGFLSGIHKSPYKGFSVEFAEHRQYYPGDEIRHVDWRVYGKTDRYYVKEFEEETNLRACIVLDASGSMAYQGAHPGKFEYARLVAASLAYLMLHQRDAVGLATHDTQLRQLVPPRATSKHLLHLLRTLEDTRPGGETSLAPLWERLAVRLKRRGLVVLLSDCFEQTGPLLRALQHFRHRKHEVLLLHILAPEEVEFPFSKWTQFRSLEQASHRVLVDPRRLRRDYLERFGAFCAELREGAARAQVDYHLMRTDEPVRRALGIYLGKRQRRR
jgi:uncharacterized protein (DUF58 family)